MKNTLCYRAEFVRVTRLMFGFILPLSFIWIARGVVEGSLLNLLSSLFHVWAFIFFVFVCFVLFC